MNIFNRIIIILLTLTAMTLSLLLLAEVFNLASLENFGLPFLLTEQIRSVIEDDWQMRLISGGIFFGVFVLGAVLLYVELRYFFLGGPRILISKDAFGKVEIAENCISKLIDYEARRLDKKSTTSTKITKNGTGLQLKSRITIENQGDIAEFSKQLKINVLNGLAGNLGILTDNLSLEIRVNNSR
jgi:hypothetical protein